MMRRYSDAILSKFDEDDDEKSGQLDHKPEAQLRTKNNKRLASEQGSDLYWHNAAPSLVLLRKRRPDYLDAQGWLYWSADHFSSFSHTQLELERHALRTGRGRVRVFFVAPPQDAELELLPDEGDTVVLTSLAPGGVDGPVQELRVVESSGDVPGVPHSRRTRFVVLEGFEASTELESAGVQPTIRPESAQTKPEFVPKPFHLIHKSLLK